MRITNLRYRTEEAPNEYYPTLIANTGDDAVQEIEFETDYSFVSTTSEPVEISGDEVTLIGGDWSEKGVVAGDSFSINMDGSGGGSYVQFVTVNFVNGDTMVLDSPIGSFIDQFMSPWDTGSIFPNGQDNPAFRAFTDKSPEGIEYYFNLIPNNSQDNPNSYIDAEVNRFIKDNVQSMVVNSTFILDQQGNKSGGIVYKVQLDRLPDVTSPDHELDVKKFRLTTFFNVYTYFEPDESGKPTFFDAQNSVKPYFELNLQSQYNNPNGINSLTLDNGDGNVGWYNENFSGGNNPHSVQSLSYTVSGQNVSAIDYTQTTQMEAVINVPNIRQNDLFNFTWVYIPEDDAYYKNQPLSLENQLIRLSSPNMAMFSHSVNSQGSFNSVGNAVNAKMSGNNVFFIVDEINETLTVRIDFVPNSDMPPFMDSRDQGDRKYRLSFSVQGDSPDHNSSDRVQLLIDEGQLVTNPVIGGEFDGEVDTEIYNHPQDPDNTSGTNVADTFKEDDSLFESDFVFDVNDTWQSLSARVEVVDTGGGTLNDATVLFPLEQFNLNFSNQPTLPDGTQEIDISVGSNASGRPVNQDARDRVTVKRLTSLDSGNDRGYRLRYGLLSRWEYYVENNAVTNQFFDANSQFNGKNNNWMRLIGGDIKLVISYNVVRDGITYFIRRLLQIDDYDSSAEITSNVTYEDENGNSVTSLIDGQRIKVIAEHTLSGNYVWSQTDTWGWLGLRPAEGTPIKLISTAYDWTNNALPWRPLMGATRADLTFPSANVARVEALFDTNFLQSFPNFTITARIQDPEITPPLDGKEMEDGTIKNTENNEIKNLE